MSGRFKAFTSVSLATALLTLASCGGDTDLAETKPTSQDTGTGQQDQSQEQETEDTEAASTIPCDDPPPSEIALDTSVTSEVDGFDQCFQLEVPSDLTSLTIEVTGLTSPLNLFVGYDDVETIQFHIGELWQSTEEDIADEFVTIENPKAGIYYINVAVGAIQNSSPFTLTTRSTS
jgi:hypothetical protein